MAILPLLVKRVPVISDTSKGPIVNLVAWNAMTIMCLAVVTVLISKAVVARKLSWKDLIITSAMLVGIGFTASINTQVSNGLGSPISTLSEGQYLSFQKAGYASHLLYILGLFLGKASTLCLLLSLSPVKSYRMPPLIVGVITFLWAIASLFASAFQCSVPEPWLYTSGKCFDQTVFWDTVEAVSIATDIAIMALPVFLVHNLQLPIQKKLALCFAFSFRTLAIGCAVVRIVELPKLFKRDTDITFDSWIPTMVTILELFFNIFAACVPHLRPFMESIQAGYLSGVIEGNDTLVGYGDDSYLMRHHNRVETREKVASQAQKVQTGHGESFEIHRQGSTKGGARRQSSDETVRSQWANCQVSAGEKGDASHNQSTGSQTNSTLVDGCESDASNASKAIIITTTKEWSISYRDA